MGHFTEPLFVMLAILAAGIMGVAIQRGATCAVTAMDGITARRDINMLAAMLEAALWVAVGLGLAQRFHLLNELPRGYAISIWTFIGAGILGLGAYINGSCVIGTIGKIGSGQLAYLLTPIGFFLGCASQGWLFGMPTHQTQPSATAMALAASLTLWPLLGLVLWRLYALFLRRRTDLNQIKSRHWSPHAATLVIGFAFLVSVLFYGKWTYTEVLAEIAHGMSEHVSVRIVLAVSLLTGAIAGGIMAGQFHWHKPTLTKAARCLVGGMMMAWGSLLIPGSNDSLILVGMPLLWPYAWVAFLTMCAVIGSAQIIARRVF